MLDALEKFDMSLIAILRLFAAHPSPGSGLFLLFHARREAGRPHHAERMIGAGQPGAGSEP
ncbi:hypothetical protein [Oryzihumus sp.]|uniref:hypothetical protein n=1 Tax=Oryzihumus sp. TaxID=1968903 RepID=UPI002ED8D185